MFFLPLVHLFKQAIDHSEEKERIILLFIQERDWFVLLPANYHGKRFKLGGECMHNKGTPGPHISHLDWE